MTASSLRVQETALAGLLVVEPPRFHDARGFFSEVYNRRALAEAGITLDFVQDNHAYSADRFTVRGLHFQVPPSAQAKLIRVARGAIFDVAVDLRRSSPTRGRHVSRILSAEGWEQLLIPEGFAHGYCTLEPETEVLYKTTGHHDPARERGIRWNDPELGIAWPAEEGKALVSEKDRALPLLSELGEPFPFDG